MDLVQRSYSGHTFRPRPIIEIEKTTNTLIIATPWGASDQAQMVIDLIKEQLSVSQQPEATRVGGFIEGLSEDGNRLRAAAALANEQLYHRENSKEYSIAVEIALISVQKRSLSWVQLGTPHLILLGNEGFQPLASTPDWSWQLQQAAPLVSKGLGMEKNSYFNCGSSRFKGGEKLFLISRSVVPASVYALREPDLNSCAEALVEDNSDAPFWLGVLEL